MRLRALRRVCRGPEVAQPAGAFGQFEAAQAAVAEMTTTVIRGHPM
jgi:hypothetical protein